MSKIKNMLDRALSMTAGICPKTELVDMAVRPNDYTDAPFTGEIVVNERDVVTELIEQSKSSRTMVLNFASAINPGGGVRNGSSAQEENLCAASNLLTGLEANPQFYRQQRASGKPEYLDLALVSYDVAFVLDAHGVPLPGKSFADVLTYAAPNQHVCPRPLAEQTMLRRVEQLVRFADSSGVETLIAGAWGCGVFRNEPEHVAVSFRDALARTGGNSLKRVIFTIYGGGINFLTFLHVLK